jgi:membrane associated rhomboid family serine protease
MMEVSALSHGEWWRLFTATWLHANVAHLATNAVFGFLFLGLAMGRYGPGVGLLAAYLAGVGGNGVDWLVYDANQRGLGASGVVMGALGLLTIPPVALFRQRRARAFKLMTAALLSGALLFAFLGVSPEADVVAHFGGFASGILLGLLLALAPKLGQRPWVNFTAGIFFVVFVILPWLRAVG